LVGMRRATRTAFSLPPHPRRAMAPYGLSHSHSLLSTMNTPSTVNTPLLNSLPESAMALPGGEGYFVQYTADNPAWTFMWPWRVWQSPMFGIQPGDMLSIDLVRLPLAGDIVAFYREGDPCISLRVHAIDTEGGAADRVGVVTSTTRRLVPWTEEQTQPVKEYMAKHCPDQSAG
jgi:hypothetical protein